MLRPGSAIKRKQKPLPSQIASNKQVHITLNMKSINDIGREQAT